MNIIQLLHALAFLNTKYTEIELHKGCSKEILDLILHTGSEPKFLTVFERRLKELILYGVEAYQHCKEHEHIYGGIYSMHLVFKGNNLRILYGTHDSIIFLLLCFHEREGKYRTDYTEKMPLAKERLEEIKDN